MRVLTSSLVVVALAAVGCSSGGGGDNAPDRTPSVTGSGDHLAALNNPDNPRPNETAVQIVTGESVVAVDSFDETKNGKSTGAIYVEDLGRVGSDDKVQSCADVACPYAGIELFAPSFNPPALRVAAGDVVDCRGQYQEFPGPTTGPFDPGQTLPELVGPTVSLRFEYEPLPPVKIDVLDLTNYAKGRQWLGMLVELDDVVIDSPPTAGSNRYAARLRVGAGLPANQLPTVTNALFDMEKSGAKLDAGAHYSKIIGVVQFFYNFSIAPRSAADLVP